MKTVLIVDDEIDMCSMIKLFLTKKNYEVHVAHTLTDGFNKMNSVLPDALLLDNNLPDGMGWKVAQNIHEKFPEMHITLISAYHSAKDFINKTNSNGAINILEKPISLKDIEQYL
ncbi:MAG: response regulator [Ferruginibacter sp.]